MPRYEYKVVPAPTKGLKVKNIKGAEARFSHALQELMNGLSGYGWEYQRAETLPSTERVGLTGSTTEWRNVLVFRRRREEAPDTAPTELLPPPSDAMEEPEATALNADTDKTEDESYFEDQHGETDEDEETAEVAPSMLNALASRRKSSTVEIPAETKPEGEQQASKTEAKTDTQTKANDATEEKPAGDPQTKSVDEKGAKASDETEAAPAPEDAPAPKVDKTPD